MDFPMQHPDWLCQQYDDWHGELCCANGELTGLGQHLDAINERYCGSEVHKQCQQLQTRCDTQSHLVRDLIRCVEQAQRQVTQTGSTDRLGVHAFGRTQQVTRYMVQIRQDFLAIQLDVLLFISIWA